MTDVAEVSATDHPARTARFGVFEVDLRTGELHRDGVRIKLQDQPFRLLVFLLERPGEVVNRDELRQRLWPSEFVDFDHSLNTAVRKLRTALDDTADNPRFIETLAKRGYRFIAPVSWDRDEPAPRSPEPVIEAPKKPRAIMWRPIFAALLLLAVFVAAWFGFRSRVPVPHVTAIAVLPFTNPDAKTQHVSDGLTEILIDTMSRVPDLRVMARTTSFQHKGKDPREIGEDLHVGAVVTGNVQSEADGYRVHVELIDVKDGTQLWGRQYRTTNATLADTQSMISGDLTSELRAGLDRDRRNLVTRGYTRSAEAYELYLKGLYRWNQRGEENVRASIDLFNQAVAADPTFAAAYAGIANAYGVLVGSGFIPPKDGTPLVMSASRKALELDADNAEAYVSMATTQFRNLWDFTAADANYKKGLALNPNYATGHQWYSDFLRSIGHPEESRREIDLAYQLDPLSLPIAATKCWNYYALREYEAAIAFAEKSRQVDPRLGIPFCRGRALLAVGRYEEAYDLTTPNEPGGEELARRYREAFRSRGLRGLYELRLGFLLERSNRQDLVPVEIAATYAMLGKRDQAFAWLEKAFEQRVSRVTNINSDPELDPIRDDPRFDDLLRRIGIPRLKFQGPPMKPVA